MEEFYNPKIGDFGLSTEIEGEDCKLQKYVGTRTNTAHEIIYIRLYNGIKADIFSLGAILFILVTCKN